MSINGWRTVDDVIKLPSWTTVSTTTREVEFMPPVRDDLNSVLNLTYFLSAQVDPNIFNGIIAEKNAMDIVKQLIIYNYVNMSKDKLFLTETFDTSVPLILSVPFNDYEMEIRERLSKYFVRNYV